MSDEQFRAYTLDEQGHFSQEDGGLVDLLDRVLSIGVVAVGEAKLGIGGVDLVHVGLKLFIASEDKAMQLKEELKP